MVDRGDLHFDYKSTIIIKDDQEKRKSGKTGEVDYKYATTCHVRPRHMWHGTDIIIVN